MHQATRINSQPLILRYGYSRWAALIILLAFGGFSYWFWREGISGWPAVVWFGFSAFVIVGGFLFGHTEVVADVGKVVRVWKLLGLLTLWRREYSLTSFRGVQQRHFRGAEDSTWMVGFLDPFGRFLAVQWFLSGSVEGACSEAADYASHLSQLTGLPIVETYVA
jgi:hypothetical protein